MLHINMFFYAHAQRFGKSIRERCNCPNPWNRVPSPKLLCVVFRSVSPNLKLCICLQVNCLAYLCARVLSSFNDECLPQSAYAIAMQRSLDYVLMCAVHYTLRMLCMTTHTATMVGGRVSRAPPAKRDANTVLCTFLSFIPGTLSSSHVLSYLNHPKAVHVFSLSLSLSYQHATNPPHNTNAKLIC